MQRSKKLKIVLQIATTESLFENLVYLPCFDDNTWGTEADRRIHSYIYPGWHQLCCNYAVIRDNFMHDTGLDRFSQRNKQLSQEKQNNCKLDNHGWDKMRIHFSSASKKRCLQPEVDSKFQVGWLKSASGWLAWFELIYRCWWNIAVDFKTLNYRQITASIDKTTPLL